MLNLVAVLCSLEYAQHMSYSQKYQHKDFFQNSQLTFLHIDRGSHEAGERDVRSFWFCFKT